MSVSWDVVVFDLGGVLVELGQLRLQTIGSEGLNPAAFWERWLRSTSVRRFESGRCSSTRFARDVIEEFGLRHEPDAFLREFEHWPRGPYPGAIELLVELRAAGGFRLACLSNCNAIHWPRFAQMGLMEQLDSAFSSHELGCLKPDPEIFGRVVDALGRPPGRILFLDDNRLNVDGARHAGLDAHQVQGPKQARALLAQLGLLPTHGP